MRYLSIQLCLIMFLGISTSFLFHGGENTQGDIVAHVQNGYTIEKLRG